MDVGRPGLLRDVDKHPGAMKDWKEAGWDAPVVKEPAMPYQPILLNVLGYQEESGWVALALEMDLRGYGDTFEDALEELTELVETQISFSRLKGQPELIWKAAEPVWFERFAEARRDYFDALVREGEIAEREYMVAGLPIPPAHVIESLRNNFVQSEV
jgi:hypothetical protein